ncbi:hypothetical protein NSK_001334 [Nannochloropsis salina CCMP1776]|jgi:acetylornithine/succinyldiaminopimelate/putrescine aminotransferase|uniref:Uncharacterized protein n=1 Tax=Nannochloropsis salina CCMP1776 TaxID=1027361 RepID=A0A4D9D6B6_9STRA|nr:hypothetical protein NSK_001334 [Nannochloropsis salina CCMP1776]|eukprot:TFJ87000.1 hypothetical protein NSK_001334 [Nannochloropsis salina CCMP1776]
MAIVDSTTNPAPTNTKKGQKKSAPAIPVETAPVGEAAPDVVSNADKQEETTSTVEATIAPEEDADLNMELPYVAKVASDTTSAVLAESYLLTQRGLETLKAIDSRVGVTKRLMDLDESMGVSKRVLATAEHLGAHTQALDAKYHVTAKIKDTAESVSEKALEYPYVASGAEKTGKAVKFVERWSRSTLAKARSKVETRKNKKGKTASPVPLTGEEEVPIDLARK